MHSLALSAKSYRLLYNTKSAILLVAIYVLVPPDPALLYAIPAPLAYLFWGVQLMAVLVFLRGLRDFEVSAFLGVAGDAGSRETLNTGGLFRYCRHPLYSASMLFLLANPVMTLGWAAYSVSIILYFVIGSIFEERHLEARFGAAYRAYQKDVPRFLPKLFGRTR